MIDKHIHSTLIDLLNLASSREIKLFVVGGTLRDYFLKKNISDIDITAKNAANLGIQFAQSLNYTHVALDKTPGRATTRIILPHKTHIDLTDLQGTKIEEDLKKRDFTINAMAQELSGFLSKKKNIIDPHFGKDDLNNSLIKATSSTVFQVDPLRMLRAFRFAAQMNLSIDEETLNQISKNNQKITTVPRERIWQELILFLDTKNTGNLVNLMQKSGLINYLLPSSSLSDWKSFLSSYNQLEHILSKPSLYFSGQPLGIKSKEKVLLKISLFLKETDTNLTIEKKRKKDFGTPNCFEFLKTLKAGNSEISFICKSIQCSNFFSKSLSSTLNNSLLYDLCVMGGNELIPGVLLQVSSLSFTENSECTEVKLFNTFSQLLKFYFERYSPVIMDKPLLNGKDIIKKFNISESPVLGIVLNNIQRAHVLGKIKTKAEAEMLAEKFLKSNEYE